MLLDYASFSLASWVLMAEYCRVTRIIDISACFRRHRRHLSRQNLRGLLGSADRSATSEGIA